MRTPVILRVSVLLLVAASASAANEGVCIYHDDPQHPWNRLYAAFYVREVPLVVRGEGEANSRLLLGPNVLDPPLGRHPRFLLDDEPFKSCNAALDEFINAKADRLITDPLRRAVLQRDLWAVFDLLQADPRRVTHGLMLEGGLPTLTHEQRARRAALSRKIVMVLKTLALSTGDIERLPNTFPEAVRPPENEAMRQSTIGLPADLLDPKGSWVEIVKPAPRLFGHTRQVDGRSVFRVFYRAPDEWGGRERLQRWLIERQARSETDSSNVSTSQPKRTEELSIGMQFVLLRQMICIDEHLKLVPTKVVESVQLRITRPDPAAKDGDFDQSFAEYEMDRRRLFGHRSGGLMPAEVGATRPSGLAALGRLHTNARGFLATRQPFMANCLACHGGRTVGGEVLLTVSIRSLHDAHPLQSGDSSQAERTILWKEQQVDYKRLVKLWKEAAQQSSHP